MIAMGCMLDGCRRRRRWGPASHTRAHIPFPGHAASHVGLHCPPVGCTGLLRVGVDASRLGPFCATGRAVCMCGFPAGGFFWGGLSGLHFAHACASCLGRGCRCCTVGVFEWCHRTDFLRRHSPCFVRVEGPRGLQAGRVIIFIIIQHIKTSQ